VTEISRDLLDDCVHCGFCLPTCPTYGPLWQEEMDSPRGRILLMSGLVDGTVELSPTTVQHFDRCLGCMACVTSCPSGVQYDRLIEQTRAHVEEHHQRSDDERLMRALVFATVPYPRRLRLALALTPPRLPGPLAPFARLRPPWRSAALPPEVTPAVGEKRLRVGLLLGCVQRVVFGDVNAATARVLAAEGCEVVAPRSQGCCGALHLHAGRLGEGRRRARRIADALGDVDAIVVNAAGCGSHLKEAELPVRVVDVSELVAELEPRAERHELPVRVAYQDACHLGHAQGIRDAPREVLRSIPGLELVEPAEQAICCGSAGIYNLVQPVAAGELGARKASNVAAAAADVYASGNPGCLVQVSTYLRRAGHAVPALHPVELLDASMRNVARDRLLASARR
jgi:glycolate oxidase iron-sulfur subunit